MEPELISDVLGTWGYSAFLMMLLLTGVGSPVPEDLLLVTAGYLVFTNVFEWPVALLLGVAGVVGSDVVLYSAGRHLAWRSARGSERRVRWLERVQRTALWFARLGPVAVFVARLVPGTRTLVFVSAGLQGMPISQFVKYDTLGAVLWVAMMLVAGHRLGQHVGGLHDVLSWLRQGSLWIVTLVAVLLMLWLQFGREQSKL